MCENFYQTSLTLVLTKHDWTFARRYRKLNQLVLPDPDIIPQGNVAYEIPSDCLIPRNIHPRNSRKRWEVMGNMLVTCEVEVGLYYTHSETRPENFSDTFVRVLSLLIAVKLSGPITQDKQLTSVLNNQYQAERGDHHATDANIGEDYRNLNETPENDTFVNAGANGNFYV